MKLTTRIFSILFISFFLAVSAGADVVFSPIQNISNTPSQPSDEHRIDADGEQYYLVWNKWGDILFKRSLDSGEAWGSTVTIYSAFDYGGSYPAVAGSDGNVYVVYYRNTLGNSEIFFSRSLDNGVTFSPEVALSDANWGAITPMIAARGDTVFVAYEDRDSNSRYQIYLQISTDAGDTWSGPQQISDSAYHSRWCNVTYADSVLYMTWNAQVGSNYDDLDIFFSKSTDLGQTWTSAVNVTNNQAYNARLSTVVLDDMVYIAASSKLDDLQADAVLYRSSDLGDTWDMVANLSDNTGDSSRPAVWAAANAYNDHRLYVTWVDDTFSADGLVYLRYSLDNGQNWSEPLLAGQENGNAGWAQVIGDTDDSGDQLFLAWYHAPQGTFDFDVYGRQALSTLSLGTLTGMVTDLEGQSVANATVAAGIFSTFTDEDGFYEMTLDAGTYDVSVVASGYAPSVNENVQITPGAVTTLDVVLQPQDDILFPPQNLQATADDLNVVLTWNSPTANGEWLQWGSDQNVDTVGGDGVPVFDAAIRFIPSDLVGYDGYYLTRISFFIEDTDCEIFARVWTGGSQNYAGNLVYETPVADLTPSSWHTIELSQPIPIDPTQELWFGYRVINPNGVYPAGTDGGPAVSFRGDMLLYGSQWISMYDYFGWDINWNIKGYVVDANPQPGQATELSVLPDPMVPEPTGSLQRMQPEREPIPFRETLIQPDGYSIYRNDALLSTIGPDTTFLDILLEPDTYTYYVTALYGTDESPPSNSVTVNVSTAIEESDADITETKFIGAYPNPFAGETQLAFQLAQPQHVQLDVYAINGQKIVSLIDRVLPRGTHTVSWNGRTANSSSVATGTYLFRLKMGNQLAIQRVQMIR